MTNLSEFELFDSRSGAPSVVHTPSHTLIHSRVDPVAEAEEIVRGAGTGTGTATVVIGGGVGYLPEAVLSVRGASHRVFVIEPHHELRFLAERCRRESNYCNSPWIRVITGTTQSTLAAKTAMIPAESNVLVSPYLLRLSEKDNSPLKDFLRIARAELASRAVYNPLLERHIKLAYERLADLPPARSYRLPSDKVSVVVGAGPSLTACLQALSQHRSQVTLLAASGAVPALLKARLIPDWVFALEARDAIIGDISGLPLGAKVVVFPATQPQVIVSDRFTLLRGELETQGGSSVIPALDFALRAGSETILLVGMDLSNRHGMYAENSRRAGEIASEMPPKFLSMRAGLERLLSAGSASVYHVLPDGLPLKGTIMLHPDCLPEFLKERLLSEVQCVA